MTTIEEAQRVVAFGTLSTQSCESCARELSPNFAFCPFCGVKRHDWHLQMPAQRTVPDQEAVNE